VPTGGIATCHQILILWDKVDMLKVHKPISGNPHGLQKVRKLSSRAEGEVYISSLNDMPFSIICCLAEEMRLSGDDMSMPKVQQRVTCDVYLSVVQQLQQDSRSSNRNTTENKDLLGGS
jgi:hypothetical protein